MVANHDNMLLTFDTCNMEYFEGKLLFPQFGLLHSYRTCGYFHCDYEQGWFSRELYNFKISITDYYDFTPKQFRDIMVHEMIHYYLAYFGLDKSCSHGREFKKMAKRLNQSYNLNVTKNLDISQYKRRKGTPTISYWLAQIF
ncbi:MAG: SprT-like domain-containing protein [Prevotella sp.]|nr:SprT-like domain-containing protein [Prevotella sp.]